MGCRVTQKYAQRTGYRPHRYPTPARLILNKVVVDIDWPKTLQIPPRFIAPLEELLNSSVPLVVCRSTEPSFVAHPFDVAVEMVLKWLLPGWFTPPSKKPQPRPGGNDHSRTHCDAGMYRFSLPHEFKQLVDIDAYRRCRGKKASNPDELIALYRQ